MRSKLTTLGLLIFASIGPVLPVMASLDVQGSNKCHADYFLHWTPVIATPTTSPCLFKGSEGKYHIAYELVLSNFNSSDTTINSIDVFDAEHPGKSILHLADETLAKALLLIGAPKGTKITAGSCGAAFINVQFDDPKQAPSRIAHKFQVAYKNPNNVSVTREYTTAEVTVDPSSPVVISSPLRGERWVASGGYNGSMGHRKALFPVSGEIKLAQRLAIDWIKLNSDNLEYAGDSSKCESYFAFGQPIHSVCDGTICGAIDKFADQAPLMPPAGPIFEYPGGNAVTVDMGDGKYAFYGHMKRGSVAVKEGDKVKKGQVLGLLGNSGNSTGPHLHFHVSDSPVVMTADSKPYLFDSFKQVGMINEAAIAFDLLDKGTPVVVEPVQVGEHRDELITEGAVVNFSAP
jgi:Peptidase family M23